MAFINYNINPKHKKTGDCSIRAVAVATGLSWEQAYEGLAKSGLKCKTAMNDVEAINDFLKKGKQFGYIRRYETELNLVKDNLFNDILLNGRFDIKMKLVGNEWLINDEVAGYAFVLSKAKDYE